MITRKVCPQCGSPDVTRIAGDLFMCQNCGYSGSFKEKPIIGRVNPMDSEFEDIETEIKPIGMSSKIKSVKKSVKKEVKKNVKRR